MKSMGNIYHRQQAYLRTKAGLWFDTVAAWFEGYTGVDLWKDDWMEEKR